MKVCCLSCSKSKELLTNAEEKTLIKLDTKNKPISTWLETNAHEGEPPGESLSEHYVLKICQCVRTLCHSRVPQCKNINSVVSKYCPTVCVSFNNSVVSEYCTTVCVSYINSVVSEYSVTVCVCIIHKFSCVRPGFIIGLNMVKLNSYSPNADPIWTLLLSRQKLSYMY